jgi:hypothetical protein
MTGRPTSHAAIAVSATNRQVNPLHPKPPSTNGQITRICSGVMPNRTASACREPEIACVAL